MPKKKENNSLRTWIDSVGVHKIAKKLKVHSSTVWNWRRGYVLPGGMKLRKLIEFSDGMLTMQAIQDYFYSEANKKNRWNS